MLMTIRLMCRFPLLLRLLLLNVYLRADLFCLDLIRLSFFFPFSFANTVTYSLSGGDGLLLLFLLYDCFPSRCFIACYLLAQICPLFGLTGCFLNLGVVVVDDAAAAAAYVQWPYSFMDTSMTLCYAIVRISTCLRVLLNQPAGNLSCKSDQQQQQLVYAS